MYYQLYSNRLRAICSVFSGSGDTVVTMVYAAKVMKELDLLDGLTIYNYRKH